MTEQGMRRAAFASRHHLIEARKAISKAHNHLRKAQKFAKVANLPIAEEASVLLKAFAELWKEGED